MASLQARHSRGCAIVRQRVADKLAEGAPGGVTLWTTFDAAMKQRGCDCTPLYHVVLLHDGKLIREPVGHNRREAARALDARRGDVARREYHVVQDIRFDAWADNWLAGFAGKQNTAIVYGQSLEYAKQTFGATKVRDLTPTDVRRFLAHIQKANTDRRRAKVGEPAAAVSPGTLAKHLRQLGVCLQAAIDEKYATENPVRQLPKSLRPKAAKSRPVYYTDDELVRLWPELAFRPLMLALCKTAAGTGLRLGELAALKWDDIDLLNREIRVSRTFTAGIGETTPKSGEARTIDLTPPAATMLERWFAESGGSDLVFGREEGGHLNSKYVTTRVLYPALKCAGIPRVGERGRKRDFHSFRHTFARIALEGGAEITWVQKQLGHSSITLTVDTYGSWARAAEKSQAERLAGAFAL